MEKLGVLRKGAGLTQAELAELLNVNRTTVAMWESGKNTPPTKYLLPLVRILNCTVEDILMSE